MGFNPQIWSAETSRIMKKKLGTSFRISGSVVDYTRFTKGRKAEGYNGPYLGSVQAKDMPIAEEDFNDPNKQNLQFLFDQEKGVPIRISDIDEAQSIIGLRKEYSEMAADALLDVYDLFVITLMLNNIDSGNRITKDDSTNNLLTEADFKAARLKLNQAGAPLGKRYAVLNVDDENELTNIDGFVSRDKMGEANLPEGIVGKAHGFRITLYKDMPNVLSTDGTIGGGSGTKKANLFYHKNVVGWGRQKEFGSKIEPKAGSASDLINIYSVFGGVVQASNFGVSVRDN